MNTGIMKEDLETICSAKYIPWECLKFKTILITGATGLIGTNLVKSLLFADLQMQLGIKVIAFVRNKEKAENIFADNLLYGNLLILQGTLDEPIFVDEPIDYIIHGASVTSSKAFVNTPVEVIRTAIDGTVNVLELARKHNVSGFVFLSTMEVYGSPKKGQSVSEKMISGFDPTNVRNCYPIGKQLCESMCMSYASEYEVPVMCVRLTQTFGPGVAADDGRVFAEFIRCVLQKKDIVLKTKGETERCYLYTADSVTAILTVLLKGQKKEIYNAANPATYCSIREMAELVAHKIADDAIKVKIELDDISKYGFAETLYMQLDTQKLESLGWKPQTSLSEMYHRLMLSWNT